MGLVGRKVCVVVARELPRLEVADGSRCVRPDFEPDGAGGVMRLFSRSI